MEPLKTSLNEYHMDSLRDIASTLSLDTPRGALRKSWLVRALNRAILDLAKSRESMLALGEAQRRALGLLLRENGASTVRNIALPMMLSGLVYVEGQPETAKLPRLQAVLDDLLHRGLLINLTAPKYGSTRRTLDQTHTFAISPEVRAVLPRDVLQPPKRQKVPELMEPPAYVVSTDPEIGLRELFFMWSDLRREPARQLKAGGVSKRDLRRIAQSMGLDVDEDRGHLDWLYEMLQTLKLIKVRGRSIEAVESDAVKLFWAAQPITQLREVLSQYTKNTKEIEIDTSQLARYSYYYYHLSLRSASEIRSQVLDVLQKVAGGAWLSLSLFGSFVRQGQAGGLYLDHNTLDALHRGQRLYHTSNSSLEEALEKLDRQCLVFVLRELHALGVVDLGYEAADGAINALRVTDLASAYFNNDRLPSDQAEGQVVLQPDFQILAMGPVSMSQLANLERFAEREKLGDSVISYRLTRDSVYRALQNGETTERIVAFLQEVTMQPVPQNVVRSLESWGGQYERIVVRRQVTVLQVDSATLLDRLLGDAKIARYLHRLDEHTAWLRVEDSGKVERRLNELEILPATSQGPEADLPRSLRWQDDRLYARHPLPSLYVTGNVSRIAEEAEEGWRSGGWRVTPEAIEAATTTGMEIPEIIALLEMMTGSPLDPEWDKRLKAWGHYYGDGALARVTLLRLESEDALRELRRADRRLSRWIRPLPDAEGLGVVEEKNWPEVQALLAEWGLQIKEERWW